MKTAFILSLLLFSQAASAEYAALICSGSIETRDGAAKERINEVIVMDRNYNSVTLAQLSPKKDPRAHSIVAWGKENGAVEFGVQRINAGWPETATRFTFSPEQKRLSLPFSNADVELDLRCARQ